MRDALHLPHLRCRTIHGAQARIAVGEAARLAKTLAPWLDDPAARARQSALLATVRERLGEPGAAARAAAWLWEMVA